MGATSGFRASRLRSRGLQWTILAVAGAMIMAGVGLAVPAAASAVGVYTLGNNTWGELGNGTTTASQVPVGPVGLPGTASQVAAGYGASAALVNGSVWTWGNNSNGQLGYSTSTGNTTTPQQVPGLSGITQIVLTWPGNGYALGADGTVWAWGDNSDGQLGNGGTTSATVPARVPGLTGVTEVAAGNGHVLVRRSDGTVAGWGENSNGELGDGTTLNRLTPVQAQVLTGITQIATGYASYAVRSDGTLFSWGANGSGQLGNGSTGGFSTTPAPLSLPGVTQVATSSLFTLALVGSAERVYAWGSNIYGELGDGTTVDKSAPELIGLTGVSQITVSADLFYPSSSAIRYDGTLWTWGSNQWGQLDNGTSSAGTATPTAVTNLAGVSQFVTGDEFPAAGAWFDSGAYDLAIGSLVQVAVPRVIGDTTAQAGAALQAVKLTLGTVSSRVDSTCNNIGKVLSESPPAGTMLMVGTAVSITIGKSPAPPHQCP
jgi:alpha-tubulin suppressor-like RCC1 family protein